MLWVTSLHSLKALEQSRDGKLYMTNPLSLLTLRTVGTLSCKVKWRCVARLVNPTVTLSLWHLVSDLGSLTFGIWHWVSNIESLILTDIDLTNRTFPTFARCFMITDNISRAVHQTQSSMMMISIHYSESSRACKAESPNVPPLHTRQLRKALPQSQKPH